MSKRTYIRDADEAVMIEIAPHQFVSEAAARAYRVAPGRSDGDRPALIARGRR